MSTALAGEPGELLGMVAGSRVIDETAPLIAREQAAARALDQLRAAAVALSHAHPAAPLLAEAVAVAERHWDKLRAAVEAEQRQQAVDSPHPDDYWSARWRT